METVIERTRKRLDGRSLTPAEADARETEIEKALGLCATCIYEADCQYRKPGAGIVWHCEEFNDFVEPAAMNPTPPMSASEAIGEQLWMGLCVNCEHRVGCSYLKPEGGVWHCEEYA